MDGESNDCFIAGCMRGYVLVAKIEKRCLDCEMSLFMYVSIIEIEGY
jgi:hypothetical protein